MSWPNWICDCAPPLPDLMSGDISKCEICKKVKPKEKYSRKNNKNKNYEYTTKIRNRITNKRNY